MFMCRVFSCAVGRWCLLWPFCSPGKTLLAFSLAHFILQSQICLLLQLSLDFLLLHSSPYNEKDIFFVCLVLEGLIGHHRTVKPASLALVVGEKTWITVILSRLPWKWTDLSIIFEILPKYCISDSCLLWGLLHFFPGILAHSSRYNCLLN